MNPFRKEGCSRSVKISELLETGLLIIEGKYLHHTPSAPSGFPGQTFLLCRTRPKRFSSLSDLPDSEVGTLTETHVSTPDNCFRRKHD